MGKRLRRIIGLILFVWVIAMAVIAASGAAEAKSGERQLKKVASGTGLAALQSADGDADIKNAAKHFRRAHSRFSNPVFWPIKPIPVLGNQVKSAQGLTGAAAETSDITLQVLNRVRALDSSGDRPAMLREVSTICADADARLRKIDIGPKSGLIKPLGDVRESAVDNLNTLQSALVRGGAASGGLADLMSKDAKYMFVAANNAEMRNGSGMFLQAGLLSVKSSKFEIGDLVPSGELAQNGANQVSWTGDIADNWKWLGRQGDLRNLMLSPRFDANAPIAKQIWEGAGKPQVDGVLVVDVEMMRALLATVGPVEVGGFNVNKDNAVRSLMFDQYTGIDYDANTRRENIDRREGLAAVAGVAFEKFANGNWSLATAAKEFGTAAQGRHLLLWSQDATLNERWVKAGLGGQLHSGDTMVSLTNLGTNKLDQFMKVQTTLDVGQTDSATNVTMKVKVKNEAPQNGPQYVLGPIADSPAQPGQYLGMLTFSLPGDAGTIKFDQNLPMSVRGRDGDNAQIAVGLDVPRGNEQEFTLRFTRPANAVGTTVRPSAHLPAISWQFRDEKWEDKTSRTIKF